MFSMSFFLYGIMVGKHKIFPYSVIKNVRDVVSPAEKNLSRPCVTSLTKSCPYDKERMRLLDYFNNKVDIVFIGDSLTLDGIWNEFFPSLTVANRGFGGATSSDIIKRLDKVISTNPEMAFIMLGINDFLNSTPVDFVLKNFELILDELETANIEVVIQSTIQCELVVCGPEMVNSINELNANLVNLSALRGHTYLDLEDLSFTNGLFPDHTVDGIHLTAQGYIYWSEKISDLVERL